MRYQAVIATRPDLPLFAVLSGSILIRETEIERFSFAAAALCSPYSFIFFYEARIVRGSL
jgi:hypothetical protein